MEKESHILVEDSNICSPSCSNDTPKKIKGFICCKWEQAWDSAWFLFCQHPYWGNCFEFIKTKLTLCNKFKWRYKDWHFVSTFETFPQRSTTINDDEDGEIAGYLNSLLKSESKINDDEQIWVSFLTFICENTFMICFSELTIGITRSISELIYSRYWGWFRIQRVLKNIEIDMNQIRSTSSFSFT